MECQSAAFETARRTPLSVLGEASRTSPFPPVFLAWETILVVQPHIHALLDDGRAAEGRGPGQGGGGGGGGGRRVHAACVRVCIAIVKNFPCI